jgi:hypothetical protein
MKNERLPAGRVFEGCPTRPRMRQQAAEA